jgi:uncharacterized membrane protein YbhN (UPF0104 family)
MNSRSRKNLIKIVPGLLISSFFLWYTFKGISFDHIRSLRIVHPVWILGLLGFTFGSYFLRCVRWARMMRSTGAGFAVCARVLMTSLAANNILPLRIGDIMRVFTYAGDLGASPSVILSTVILEKLLDIFVLVLLFVLFMGRGANHHSQVLAWSLLIISSGGLLVMLLGARFLRKVLSRLFASFSRGKGLGSKLHKIEHWLMLALDCICEIGIAGSFVLLIESTIIWAFEAMIYVSAAEMTSLAVDRIGPWLAVSVANLSYLIPSSPGAIGTFEWAVKTSLSAHGAPEPQAALFGLALHAWLLLSVTGAGGVIFLIHRFRIHNHKPLFEEIEELPSEMP